MRRFRLRAGLTQEELAERAGLSVRTIRALESGRQTNPQLGSLRRLAAAMSLDPEETDELLTGLGLSGSGRPLVPRQLPAAPGVFAGRAAELAAIENAAITSIAGPGGIGKTWLALRWAHRNLDRFPDGQLFVDLRGFSPDSEPVEPLTVVRGFLGALGVDTGRVGGSLEEHTALYRSHVADKRMLIVLDNAATAEQVVPLLPGSATCTVLVTSRRILTGLLQRHAVNHVSLNVFGEDETHDALAQRVGDKRLAAEPDAVRELVELCGRYPLALAIVAGRAHARPDIPLAEFAAELRESGLDGFDDGDEAASLPAVMSWSVRSLTAEQRTVFGLLGIAPGPHIGAAAVASLTALRPAQVRVVMRRLEDASLVLRHPGDRHSMHDIVRHCARDTAWRDITEQDRKAALRRVLDYYIHTAHAADRVLAPYRPDVCPAPLAPGARSAEITDYAAALDWFETEHVNVLAALSIAVDNEWHGATWQLAWDSTSFHVWRGYPREDLSACHAAEQAAAHLPDPAIRVRTLRNLGIAYGVIGHHGAAVDYLDRALAEAQRLDHRAEQGLAHFQLSRAWVNKGDCQQALEHATRAFDVLCVELPVWRAAAHAQVGSCLARLGEFEAARVHCLEAERLDDHCTHELAADCQYVLGYIAHHTGRNADALDHYRQTLHLRRLLGQTDKFADILDNTGHVYVALGLPDAARKAWREAMELHRQVGRTELAKRLQTQLDELDQRVR